MKKILLIDDDNDIVEAVKHLLTSHGFDVHSYSSGINLTDVVKWNYPNLILLDIRLFGKPGTEICKELKAKYEIPIILFSADAQLGNDFEICSADAFIQKPFDIKHLVNTIRQHLN